MGFTTTNPYASYTRPTLPYYDGIITIPIVPPQPPQEKKRDSQMFDIVTVRTIAGTVGQVVNRANSEILWESRPFNKSKKKDGMMMGPVELAHQAAVEAAGIAVANLFREIPSA